MASPAKRQRLEGSFTPLYSSAAPSTASPTDNEKPFLRDAAPDTSTLTPISDDAKAADDELIIDQSREHTSHVETRQNNHEDVEMGDAHGEEGSNPLQSDHNWHWREPTAHPDAVSKRLNSEMGQLYKLLSVSTPVRGYPHPSQNLISLYGLDPITASVRRVDPATGEKINKLRKSYEGKIKELQIAGRNKPATLPKDRNRFTEILEYPEDHWENMFISGKELSKGLDMEKVRAACRISAGPLPNKEQEQWKQLLNIDEPPIKPPVKVSRPQTPATQAVQGGGVGASNPAIPRPARITAKRSYTDASYEGYAEGYGDEDDMTDDSKSGLARKRRRISEMQGQILPTSLPLSH